MSKIKWLASLVSDYGQLLAVLFGPWPTGGRPSTSVYKRQHCLRHAEIDSIGALSEGLMYFSLSLVGHRTGLFCDHGWWTARGILQLSD